MMKLYLGLFVLLALSSASVRGQESSKKKTQMPMQVPSHVQDLINDLRTAGSVSRRRHDRSRLRTSLEDRVAALERRVKKQVIFHATLTDDVYNQPDLIHPFTSTVNEGSGFIAEYGIFTAPVNGTYFFTASGSTGGLGTREVNMTMKTLSLQFLSIQDLCYVRAKQTKGDEHPNQGACTAIAHLSKGDQVWLSNYGWKTYYSHQGTAFTGYLLHPDDD